MRKENLRVDGGHTPDLSLQELVAGTTRSSHWLLPFWGPVWGSRFRDSQFVISRCGPVSLAGLPINRRPRDSPAPRASASRTQLNQLPARASAGREVVPEGLRPAQDPLRDQPASPPRGGHLPALGGTDLRGGHLLKQGALTCTGSPT